MWFPNTRDWVTANSSTPKSNCRSQRGKCTYKEFALGSDWIEQGLGPLFYKGTKFFFTNIPLLPPSEKPWLKCSGNTEIGEHVPAIGREKYPNATWERWKVKEHLWVSPCRFSRCEQTHPAHVKMLEVSRNNVTKVWQHLSRTYPGHSYFLSDSISLLLLCYHKVMKDIILRSGKNTVTKIIADILWNVLPYFFYTYLSKQQICYNTVLNLFSFHLFYHEHVFMPNHNAYSAIPLWLCHGL